MSNYIEGIGIVKTNWQLIFKWLLYSDFDQKKQNLNRIEGHTLIFNNTKDKTSFFGCQGQSKVLNSPIDR